MKFKVYKILSWDNFKVVIIQLKTNNPHQNKQAKRMLEES